jgi:maleate isomerase
LNRKDIGGVLSTRVNAPRYSNAFRIGLIVPSLNVTIEPEFNAFAPAEISIHATRLLLPKGDKEHLAQMAEDTEAAANLLATARVNVIAYACTTGSLINGLTWEKSLIKRMESRDRVPAVTTASAVIDALSKLHISKVAVGTPYVDEINTEEKKFLEKSGIEVTKIYGLGYVDGEALHKEPPETAVKLAKRVDSKEADGIFLSCTDLKTFTVLDSIEKTLGKPVVSSNSATLWKCLETMGWKGKESVTLGALFASPVRRL